MKRNFILSFAIVLLFSSSLAALDFGIGLRGGKDFYRISNLKTGFRLLDLSEASVSRDGFSDPWTVGLSLSFDLNNNWRLTVSGDAVKVKYNVLFSRRNPTFCSPFSKTSAYKIDWGRVSILGTLERSWQISKTFSFFAGAGAGLHILAPVVSEKFLVNTIYDTFTELDVSKDIKMSYKPGGHALIGVEAKTFGGKLSFMVEGRYNLMAPGKYEEPNSFITVLSGIVFNIKL